MTIVSNQHIENVTEQLKRLLLLRLVRNNYDAFYIVYSTMVSLGFAKFKDNFFYAVNCGVL